MILRQLTLLFFVLLTVPVCAQMFTNYTTADGLVDNTVNCLAVDTEDNMWFGTDAGISFLDVEEEEWVTLNVAQGTGLIDDRITAIHMSPFTGLWVGTDFGISNWDGTQFTSYTEADGIGDNRIQWISEDNEGQLYFANKDGFAIYDGEDWKTFGGAEGIPFGGVTSISSVDGDVAVLGLGLDGVAIFDVIDTLIVFFGEDEGLLSNKVKSVFFHEDADGADEEDEIWVASDNGMNRIYEDDNEEIVIESHPSIFELPPPHEVNQLTDVKVDSKGIVWAGLWIEYLTNVGGISYYDGETWTSLDVDDGLVGPVVYQLAIDSTDCVWVATSSGVSRYCAEPSAIDNVELSELSFFPNPVEGQLTIEFGELSREGLELSVYTSEMRAVLHEKIGKGTQRHTIDLGQYSSGIYFVKVGSEMYKLIKN